MKREEMKKEKPIDNLSYQVDKEKMQEGNGMLVADLSSKMNTKQINAYIKAYKSGAPVKDILPKGLTKKDLLQLENLAKKRN